MYARVQYRGRAYYSYVFAYFTHDYLPYYVVYDPIGDRFDIVSVFSTDADGHRQLGLMNEHEDGFVKGAAMKLNMGEITNLVGYPWLVEDATLLSQIELAAPVDEKYVKAAKEMNATTDPDGWNEISCEADADDMMEHTGGLHDWYLISIEAKSDPYSCEEEATVRLKFNSQAAFDLLLEFEGCIGIDYAFSNFNRIYSSCILFKDGMLYFVDSDEVDPENIHACSSVSGKRLRWKFVVKENNDW